MFIWKIKLKFVLIILWNDLIGISLYIISPLPLRRERELHPTVGSRLECMDMKPAFQPHHRWVRRIIFLDLMNANRVSFWKSRSKKAGFGSRSVKNIYVLITKVGILAAFHSLQQNWRQSMQRKRYNLFFGKPICGIRWSPRQHESWQ